MKDVLRYLPVLLALKAASFAGVNINQPANGATTNSPLHVVASATPTSAAPITAVQVYVDGGLAYMANASGLDAYFNVGAGQHTVAVQAWDASGAQQVQQVVVNGTGLGVFLSSPGANATVNGQAHVVASAASGRPITAMQIYDNGNLINQVNAPTVDTMVNLAPGTHYVVVQSWDAAGSTYANPVTVTVPGAEVAVAPPQAAPQAAAGGPPAAIPGNATTFQNIDQMPAWGSCDTCAGIGGNGPKDPYSMSEGVNSPSLDGQSAVFWLGGNIRWGSAIWWKQLGGNPGATHFVYDLQFLSNNMGASQALEFDVNQSVNGLKYIFGTECDVRTSRQWRVWDTQHAHWTDTGASCQVNNNAWNHLTWELERVGNQTHFIAVTLNGYRQVVDKYYYAKPWSGSEINVAFQMDGNEHEDNYQVWLDKVSLYYW